MEGAFKSQAGRVWGDLEAPRISDHSRVRSPERQPRLRRPYPLPRPRSGPNLQQPPPHLNSGCQPGSGPGLPQCLHVESGLAWERDLTPFLGLGAGDSYTPSLAILEWGEERRGGRVLPSPHLTGPGGCFLSRTRPPSAEAGSNEGEQLPPRQAPPSSGHFWPLPSWEICSQSQPLNMWGSKASGHGWWARLAAFPFLFPVVSSGSFTHCPGPGSGWWSRAKEQDGRAGPEALRVPAKFTVSPELGRWEGKGSNLCPSLAKRKWAGSLRVSEAVVPEVLWQHS